MILDKTQLVLDGVTHIFDHESGQLLFGISSLKKQYTGIKYNDVDVIEKEIDGREVKCIKLSDLDTTNVKKKEEDND